MNTELIKVLNELKEWADENEHWLTQNNCYVISKTYLQEELDRLIKLYGGKE